jgi:hypothetical protein
MTYFGLCPNHVHGERPQAVALCRHCGVPLCWECKEDEDGCSYQGGEVPWYRWRKEEKADD